ncbi:hypothetical protein BDN72DRAFT_498219 [Pluteus cervinus]|uniref:Uncharacterized protein n=1 Tax=Pluteus cervinus TaxID=181527 RepID=A0ACD3A5G0_9AGAR|nr:hypothetical protein BDN72DRAFT_498219 [Pluteus cervinus]
MWARSRDPTQFCVLVSTTVVVCTHFDSRRLTRIMTRGPTIKSSSDAYYVCATVYWDTVHAPQHEAGMQLYTIEASESSSTVTGVLRRTHSWVQCCLVT